jgi:DNA-binding IclR family transcriptional regulator
LIANKDSSSNGRGDDDDRATATSLRKALAVLEAVSRADVPPRISEVALKLGIPRPTAYRVVQALISAGYLSQDPQSSRLSIGLSVLQLSSSLLDRSRLRLEALPHLQALAEAAGARANLGILHREQVLYLAGIEKPSLPMIYTRFGKHAPAHCCSLGKAILAYLPQAEVKGLLAIRPLTQHTQHTITDAAYFREELEKVRHAGYATDAEEHELGSFCIAAPIFDAQRRVAGAIGLSGSSLDSVRQHIAVLKHAAEIISHVL